MEKVIETFKQEYMQALPEEKQKLVEIEETESGFLLTTPEKYWDGMPVVLEFIRLKPDGWQIRAQRPFALFSGTFLGMTGDTMEAVLNAAFLFNVFLDKKVRVVKDSSEQEMFADAWKVTGGTMRAFEAFYEEWNDLEKVSGGMVDFFRLFADDLQIPITSQRMPSGLAYSISLPAFDSLGDQLELYVKKEKKGRYSVCDDGYFMAQFKMMQEGLPGYEDKLQAIAALSKMKGLDSDVQSDDLSISFFLDEFPERFSDLLEVISLVDELTPVI